MSEFYKYAERTANSAINWAGVGMDLRDTFQEEADLREKKKAAIDEATNKTLETLANAPRGEATDGNNFTINYASDATASILMMNKLLKSGKMQPKDYVLFNSNLNSGTTQLFNLQKAYQAEFKTKMERMKSNDPNNKSQSLEGDAMGYLEGFGDLSKSKALIDPMTGRVNVGIMKDGPDGVKVLSDKTMSVSDVHRGIAQKYDYFNSLGTTDQIAGKLAPVVIETIKSQGSLGTKGRIETIDDALQDVNTQKAMELAIDSFLDLPLNVSSILTNDVKGTYHNVFTEEDRKKDPKNAILCTVNEQGFFTPNLTDEQKKVAKDYLVTLTKAQVAQKISQEVFESAAKDVEDIEIRKKQLAQNALEEENREAQRQWDRDHPKSTDGTTDISTTNLDRMWAEYVPTLIPETIPTNEDDAVKALDEVLVPKGYEVVSTNLGKDVIKIKDLQTGENSPEIPLNGADVRKTIVDYITDNFKNKESIRDYMRLRQFQQQGMFDKTPSSKTSPSGGTGKYKGVDEDGNPIFE